MYEPQLPAGQSKHTLISVDNKNFHKNHSDHIQLSLQYWPLILLNFTFLLVNGHHACCAWDEWEVTILSESIQGLTLLQKNPGTIKLLSSVFLLSEKFMKPLISEYCEIIWRFDLLSRCFLQYCNVSTNVAIFLTIHTIHQWIVELCQCRPIYFLKLFRCD